MDIHSAVETIDVVIVNWNAAHHLAACLEALAACEDRSLIKSVIIVDNGSADGSLDIALPPALRIAIDRPGRNLGFAAGSNRGARKGTAPYILFLNPDARPHSGALSAALAAFDRSSRIGIVGLRLIDEGGRTSRTCSRFPSATVFFARALGLDLLPAFGHLGPFMKDWAHTTSRPVDQVMGACFLMRRALFESLGGFDQRFFLYYEDVDLALRVRQSGLISWFEASGLVSHSGGGSSSRIPGRRLYYILASRLAYTRKNFGRGGHLAVLLITLLIEPWSRLLGAFLRSGTGGPAAVIAGYVLLLRHVAGKANP